MTNKMIDATGKAIDDTPIVGCEGCKTSAGRMGCFIHSGLNPRYVLPTENPELLKPHSPTKEL